MARTPSASLARGHRFGKRSNDWRLLSAELPRKIFEALPSAGITIRESALDTCYRFEFVDVIEQLLVRGDILNHYFGLTFGEDYGPAAFPNIRH